MAKKRVKKSVKAESGQSLATDSDCILQLVQKLWPATPDRRPMTSSSHVRLDLLARFFRLPKEKGLRDPGGYYSHWTPPEVPPTYSPLISGPPLYMMGTALQPYQISATMEYLRMHGFREEPLFALEWQGEFSPGGLTDE